MIFAYLTSTIFAYLFDKEVGIGDIMGMETCKNAAGPSKRGIDFAKELESLCISGGLTPDEKINFIAKLFDLYASGCHCKKTTGKRCAPHLI